MGLVATVLDSTAVEHARFTVSFCPQLSYNVLPVEHSSSLSQRLVDCGSQPLVCIQISWRAC